MGWAFVLQAASRTRQLLFGFAMAVGMTTGWASQPASAAEASMQPVVISQTPAASDAQPAIISGSKFQAGTANAGQALSKTFSEYMQGLALLAAALFFAWKWASGYHAFDLSIEMSTRRYRHSDDTDLLVVSLKLIKGTRESALLREIQIKLRGETAAPSRWLPAASEDAFVDAQKRMVRLTPGEITVFEELYAINAHSTVKAVADVVATPGFLEKIRWTVKGYWRSSVVSVPADRLATPDFKAGA